jgi:tetratricopeptide (TPR) repeat protein
MDWAVYVRRTHSKYVSRYLAQAKAHAQTSQADFEALEAERVNILTAMDRAHQETRWEPVLDFMNALAAYLHLRGRWRDAAQQVGLALAAARCLPDVDAQARWLFYAGLIQDELGNYEPAEADYRQSLALAESRGLTGLQAEVWRRRGWLAQVQGDGLAAEEQYRRAVELHHRAGDDLGQARDWYQFSLLALEQNCYDQARQYVRTSLGLVEGETTPEAQRLQAGGQLILGRLDLRQGQREQARQHLERALVLGAAAQDRLVQADAHFHLGLLAEEERDFQGAEQQYQGRLELAREAGDRRGEASALLALGTLQLVRSGYQSGYEEARGYYEQALAIRDRHNQAAARAQLGSLSYLQQDYPQAKAFLQEALETFRELNSQQDMAGCHQQLGLVAQTVGQWPQAAEHYQASLRLRLTLGLFHEAVQSFYQLGTLAQQLRQYQVAQRYYQQALEMGERVGFPDLAMIREALKNVDFAGR